MLVILCFASTVGAQDFNVGNYNVIWDSASGNASGAMPIGNGEVGANVWMEDNGNLMFYLSRTDAWAENSELIKLGRVRIAMHPALTGSDVQFEQRLDLERGMISVNMSKGERKAELSFWVDSKLPVVYIDGSSNFDMQVVATPEIWRTQTRVIDNPNAYFNLQRCPDDGFLTTYADSVASRDGHLVVYHRNEHSVFPYVMKHQHLDDDLSRFADPIMHRTMGYNISGNDFTLIAPTMLCSKSPARHFELKVVAHTAQTENSEAWIAQTEGIMASAPDGKTSAHRTAQYWHDYWANSYLEIETPDRTTGFRLTQAYVLQRWVAACGGRGNYPIKFNGSIFTVDPVYTHSDKPYNPDFRMWGPDYWWQNTRLMYHPMLASGDFDMMQPLFDHYMRVLPMLKRNAEVLWKSKGAVNPETATIFGTFDCRDYGWEGNHPEVIENPYVRYYWSSSLEIASLMADYYNYTLDKEFVREKLVPVANEFLTFYYTFFPRNEHGELQITPTHSLEMYWNEVLNDLPNVAGLHYLIGKLLQLPQDCTTEADRKWWREMQSILPEIPTRVVGGKTIYSAAQTYNPKATNQENPELYAVFPFSLCHVGSKNLQQGIDTYRCRALKQVQGWTQDGQQAARLGLADEAKANVIGKLNYANRHHRFPVIWGPNFDWTPDQCHGSNLLTTLQDMVVQCYDGKVYVLPAFPKEWNVRFRLHTAAKGVITGNYAQGKWMQKPEFTSTMKQKMEVMTRK
ncbi:MAG: DUF5703 domain-containing protein [Muribaculaceae bacterium]